MLCQTCEVNAAQFHIMQYDENNEMKAEWFLCIDDKNSFIATIPETDIEAYGLENMWS
jgi:protein-arginine kinase activator protein McsA